MKKVKLKLTLEVSKRFEDSVQQTSQTLGCITGWNHCSFLGVLTKNICAIYAGVSTICL